MTLPPDHGFPHVDLPAQFRPELGDDPGRPTSS